MKKLFLIVAAMFAAVSFSACSDDDDNGHVSDKPVLVKQLYYYGRIRRDRYCLF